MQGEEPVRHLSEAFICLTGSLYENGNEFGVCGTSMVLDFSPKTW